MKRNNIFFLVDFIFLIFSLDLAHSENHSKTQPETHFKANPNVLSIGSGIDRYRLEDDGHGFIKI